MRRVVPILVVAFQIGVANLLLACGSAGGDPTTGWSHYDEPEGAYRVYFLDPPWEWASHEDGVTRLRVPPNGVLSDGGRVAYDKYELLIQFSSRGAESAARRAYADARSEELDVLVEPRDFQTYDEVNAWEVTTQTQTIPLRFERQVWIEGSAGGSWLLRIASTPDPRDPEVDHLIRLFSLDPPIAEESGDEEGE